jgi:hypothetical protein
MFDLIICYFHLLIVETRALAFAAFLPSKTYNSTRKRVIGGTRRKISFGGRKWLGMKLDDSLNDEIPQEREL